MQWLILGAGTSGLGAAQWLRSRGEKVRISDSKPLPAERRAVFTELGVELRDEGHELSHLANVDTIILSPGISPTLPLLEEAGRRGIPVQSEIDLALESFSGTVICVTGTNGKSTTAVMLAHVLRRCGYRAIAGGNLGDPPTRMLAEGRLDVDYLVLELSSYQLEISKPLKPRVALFTSLSHDHTERHCSLEDYFRAKWRVFASMKKSGLGILPSYIADKARSLNFPWPEAPLWEVGGGESGGRWESKRWTSADGTKTIDLTLVPFHEPHNLANAAFACFAANAVTGRSVADFAQALGDFRGLAHRCALVGTIASHAVIDDSKSTNVEATLVALQAQKIPVVLFLGGKGKGESFAPILDHRAVVAQVVAFGASGEAIEKDLGGALPLRRYATLKEALDAMPQHLAHQAPLLLSPACASFDEFKNFEHRGNTFVAAVLPYLDPAQSPASES